MNEYWTDHPVKRGLETVKPLLDIIGDRGYIAGSYAAFMATNNPCPVLPNDVDIFATSAKNAEDIAIELSITYRLPLESPNDLLYSIPGYTIPIQIVKPHPEWKVFPDDVLNSFDLDISRALVVSPDNVLADRNVGLLDGKVLRVSNPLRTLKRVVKYGARGVQFSDHELLKMFQAWEMLDSARKENILELARLETLTPFEDESWQESTEPYEDMWDYDDDEYWDGE